MLTDGRMNSLIRSNEKNPRSGSRNGRAKLTEADISEIKTALDRFYLDNGYYPTSDQGLTSLVTAPTGGRQPANYEEGGYIEKVPADPWGTPYFYQSDGNAYVLKSFGADGKPGGSGKDEDIDGSSS